ncbi:NUDIX domain-containing protein [Chondrinema litorale]|uniref:NUDIX domain-containing protein n=1 Tax=Chondrinema litorale TaxID=2994555 RepID=UPI0025438E59|nr:NUDIX hydrolase [Chondrinema litorale]UZR94888.1 NUDIX hydrolase [Chondrinema litorale]
MSAENPWKTLKVKKVYQNPWISLSEAEVINPNGGRGIYGKVKFNSKALAIIPIDEHQNTWLVGQYRYTLNEYSWEIPMGGGKLNHDLLDSAKRELKEETGLIAAKWEQIMRIHTSNSVTDEEGFVYLAQSLTQSNTENDPTEKLEILKLPFSQAIDMVMEGKITDAISIAGLLKAGKILGI